MLEREYQYFISHHEELFSKYPNKFLVIKGEEVIGVHNSNLEAYNETVKTEKLGTFLIQECKMDIQNQVFHSRVMFA